MIIPTILAHVVFLAPAVPPGQPKNLNFFNLITKDYLQTLHDQRHKSSMPNNGHKKKSNVRQMHNIKRAYR